LKTKRKDKRKKEKEFLKESLLHFFFVSQSIARVALKHFMLLSKEQALAENFHFTHILFKKQQ